MAYMKTILLFIAFTVPSLLFSQNANELKSAAQKKNTAEAWNKLARYYYEVENDTLQLRKSAENAYRLAVKEKNDVEIGTSLIFLAELAAYTDGISVYLEKNEEALDFLNRTDRVDLQAEAYNSIGYAYNIMGRFDEAIAYHKKAEFLLSQYSKNPNRLAELYNNIGGAFINKGEQDSAIYYYLKVEKIAEATNDTSLLIQSNTGLGIVYKRNNDFKKALEHYEKTLQLYELQNDQHSKTYILINIATLYADWKKNDQALLFSRKSVETAYQYSIERDDLIRVLNNHGAILLKNHDYRAGLDTLLLVRSFAVNNEYQDYINALAISSAYFQLNDNDSCEYYLNIAEELSSANPEFPVGRFLKHKGFLLVEKGLYKQAIPFLEQNIELFNRTGLKPVSEEYEIYDYLSKAYEYGLKDYKRALFYKNLAYAKRDSLYKEEHNETVNDFYVRYQTAEKELEISRLNEERQEILYNRTLIVSGLIIITIILIIGILYNRVKRLKKEKEAMVLAKRIEEKDVEYQALQKDTELKQMRFYLDGLEAERTRLAKELHDNIANELFVVDMELKKVEKMPVAIQKRMEDLFLQVRAISHELIPPVFQHATLPEILFSHISGQDEQTGIRFTLDVRDEDVFESLPSQLSLEIYRIIQECTGNIIKHSSAENAGIFLAYESGAIVLRIEDDGKGFDVKKQNKGIGLHIMEERCKSLGGSFTITSAGMGTNVNVTIPYSTSC